MSNNPYRSHGKVVSNDKALEILRAKGLIIEAGSEFEPIDVGLCLGILTLQKSHEADDFTHGPFETYMLRHHGIIVDQPNPMASYTVYHVVEIGYTGINE